MGADAATHDAHTGTPGSFVQACRAVENLVSAGVTTDILVILTRQTAPHLQNILELGHRLGAKRVGILRLYPLGRAKAAWAEMALSLPEQMAAIAALRPPPGLGVMQSWHPNDRNCCWQAAAITAHGHSIGCMYLREYVDFGDVREIDFFRSWTERSALHIVTRRRGGEGVPQLRRHLQHRRRLPVGGLRLHRTLERARPVLPPPPTMEWIYVSSRNACYPSCP